MFDSYEASYWKEGEQDNYSLTLYFETSEHMLIILDMLEFAKSEMKADKEY